MSTKNESRSLEMTTFKKREKLQEFCNSVQCRYCPIHQNFPQHQCGNGYIFGSGIGKYDVSDEEIIKIFAFMVECVPEFLKGDKEELKNDMVNHPSHYVQGGVECIEGLKAATVNLKGIEAVCTANCIKYLWRWKEKNGLEDLKKAEWYLHRLMEEVNE